MGFSPAVPGTFFCFVAVSPCIIWGSVASLFDCLTHDAYDSNLDGASYFRMRSLLVVWASLTILPRSSARSQCQCQFGKR